MTMFARQQAAQIALPPRVGHDRREARSAGSPDGRPGSCRRRTTCSGASGPPIVPPNMSRENFDFVPPGPVRGPRRRRQLVVAPVVEAVPAELVRPRLDHHVDDGAGDVTELGRVVVRLDADLLHRIRARLVGDAVVDRLVRVHAVDREVVALHALAVDRRAARRRACCRTGSGFGSRSRRRCRASRSTGSGPGPAASRSGRARPCCRRPRSRSAARRWSPRRRPVPRRCRPPS